MRKSRALFPVLIITTCFFLGAAFANDLGSHQAINKDNSHVGMNPGTPDGRQGGETIEDAVAISALPYMDTGNTTGNINDYDAECPYGGGTAPDVVYSFTPTEDITILVDLCGSGYDTKVYIFDPELNIIACNDDFYTGDPCGLYVSLIEEASLMAGITYYIIVDGYGSDSGDYIINVEETYVPPPCILTCDGFEEGEPALVDDYVDQYNSGCGNDGPPIFQDLVGDENGELVVCGKSGWYLVDGSAEFRDTDWFTVVMGPTGMIEWTMDTELEIFGFLLGPNNCDDVAVVETITVPPCTPTTMILQGSPGDLIWVWAGPTEFAAPAGFEGNEFNYICNFVGLDQGPVATDSISFDGIKSLYR